MSGRVKRRSFLIGTTAAVIATAGAGAGLVVGTSDAHAAIARILRRLLGDVRIDDRQMQRFATDYLAAILRERGVGTRMIETLGHAEPLLRNDRLRSLLPASLRGRVDRFERHLVTRFTVGTTFFEVGDPYRDEVTYVGLNLPCRNPFARLA